MCKMTAEKDESSSVKEDRILVMRASAGIELIQLWATGLITRKRALIIFSILVMRYEPNAHLVRGP